MGGLVQILDTHKGGRGRIILIHTNFLDISKNRPKIDTRLILKRVWGRGFRFEIWISPLFPLSFLSFLFSFSVFPSLFYVFLSFPSLPYLSISLSLSLSLFPSGACPNTQYSKRENREVQDLEKIILIHTNFLDI